MHFNRNIMEYETPAWQHYFTANGVITMFEFLIGTVLNFICASYFIKKKPSATETIFIAISITDFFLSFIMVFSSVSALNGGDPLMFRDTFFCNLWGLVWHTGGGFSIFLMALLAITRWRSMVYPWRKNKKRFIIVSILAYLIVQVSKN